MVANIMQLSEVARYVVNGLVATGVHYGVLILNLEVLLFASAGLANFVAAIFGITASFVGSRYFVFQNTDESILRQALKFSGLYATIAILHGMILLLWADYFGLSYNIGFLIATFLQVSLSYLGNKRLVFSA